MTLRSDPIDALAGDVLDILDQVHAIEERLSQALRDLLALSSTMREAPAAPPPAVCRVEDIAAHKARIDTILDLWSTTRLSQEDIGEKVGRDKRTVRKIISKARRAGDPRAIVRPRQRTDPANPTQRASHSLRKHASDPEAGICDDGNVAPSPVSYTAGSEEEPTPANHVVEALVSDDAVDAASVVAAAAGETSEAPSTPAASETCEVSETCETIETKSMGQIAQEIVARRRKRNSQTPTMAFLYDEPPITVAEEPKEDPGDSVYGTIGILVDVKGCTIHGPNGDTKCEQHTARVFAHMADGGHYPVQTLAKYCDLDKALVADIMKAWGPKLADIGLSLSSYGGLYFLTRAGG